MLSCSYISWVCHLSCVCQLNVVWFCHALSCLHATNARLQEKEKLRNNSKKLEEKLQLLALSGRIANADLKQKRNDFQNRTIIEIFWLCFTCRAPQKINVRKTDNWWEITKKRENRDKQITKNRGRVPVYHFYPFLTSSGSASNAGFKFKKMAKSIELIVMFDMFGCCSYKNGQWQRNDKPIL